MTSAAAATASRRRDNAPWQECGWPTESLLWAVSRPGGEEMGVQAVERSVAVYRVLLRLYPTEHRAAYGPHMLQVFQDCCRDMYRQRQSAGLQEMWLSTALDPLKSAFEERTRRGSA
ncbi:hypothetical protein GCM10010841_27980 [Deinococcus aerophilus]|uniref:Uncharacterized protein n=1 Tax=Deinococcus aerophilus TaxID=522488 RepID=A0ABQ2GYC2_9DEIO|nr:hypothetical protein GCM10010841_27980 [Deinococcus aerophilus]